MLANILIASLGLHGGITETEWQIEREFLVETRVICATLSTPGMSGPLFVPMPKFSSTRETASLRWKDIEERKAGTCRIRERCFSRAIITRTEETEGHAVEEPVGEGLQGACFFLEDGYSALLCKSSSGEAIQFPAGVDPKALLSTLQGSLLSPLRHGGSPKLGKTWKVPLGEIVRPALVAFGSGEDILGCHWIGHPSYDIFLHMDGFVYFMVTSIPVDGPMEIALTGAGLYKRSEAGLCPPAVPVLVGGTALAEGVWSYEGSINLRGILEWDADARGPLSLKLFMTMHALEYQLLDFVKEPINDGRYWEYVAEHSGTLEASVRRKL